MNEYGNITKNINEKLINNTENLNNTLPNDIKKTNEEYEEIINEMIPGLMMYVRDVNLDKKIEDRYLPNTIITGKGFTDASKKVKGMKTTHRFSILSNHMDDFSSFEKGTNWDLHVANYNSNFLILDKYEYNGKIQILLLHLYDNEQDKILVDKKTDVLNNIIIASRKIFEKKCGLEVIPELATESWINRCSTPIGFDHEYNHHESNEINTNNNLENSYNKEDNYLINTKYDFSNIIPTIECVFYLVSYLDNIYKQYVHLLEEDEKNNEKLNPEFRNYNYKKCYSEYFEIYIGQKNYNFITCKDLDSFKEEINSGNLKNINSLKIKMKLDYKQGNKLNLVKHENEFTVYFKPYEITFTRKSTHNEVNMNKIETSIKDILGKFPALNSIFCSK